MGKVLSNQERDELHKSIWAIADDLRGAVDGWDFKSYVLGMMFYRYISENLTNYINKGEIEAGDTSFDYALMSDEDAITIRDDMVNEKGFFILPSELFSNVVKNCENPTAIFNNSLNQISNLKDNLNEFLELVFKHIQDSAIGTDSEKNFKGLFDDIDPNSNKLGSTVATRNKTLCKILKKISEIKLGNYQDNSIDAFGDAYEYLMGMYASNAGKSGGEFFTPQEVSELLMKLALKDKKEVNKVYDPACGSGSLLLQAIKLLGKDNIKKGFYGQEKNITTYNLCRINMFLHDVDFDKFDIACEDTLISPEHQNEEPFDVIVSNPPYSIKWEGDDNPILINDSRFSPAGVLAPKSKADFAFVMHILSSLSSDGCASIVCFPGIFYRGGAELKIRKYLVDNNFIDTIIQLPENLFFGTSISTCIMTLRKNRTDTIIAFIDASKEFQKVTNNNKLSEDNINNIYNYYMERKEIDHIVKLASYDDIKNNNYNLSVSTYVEKEDTREVIDINILNKEIEEIVKKEELLRKEIDKIIKEIEENE